LLVIGTAIGLVASILLARTLASRLFGVSPYDPPTLASVVLLLFAAGLAACFSRRAPPRAWTQ
jgi:hypothetical protein